MFNGTPEQVLASIVDGINTGNLDSLMPLYESQAAVATQPGSLNHGLAGVREALAGFIAMKGILDLKVTRVLEASDLALVTTVWSFTGTGPDTRRRSANTPGWRGNKPRLGTPTPRRRCTSPERSN